VLDNLIATDNPGGFAPGGRMNWAADLNLQLLSDVRTEVLFWVGDGAFDMRNQRTLRAFVKVLKASKVDFAVLGLEERDSGDVARRLGDEATFQHLAKRNIQTLAKYQLPAHRHLRPAQLPCAEKRIRRPWRRLPGAAPQHLHGRTDRRRRAQPWPAQGQQRDLPRPVLPGPLQRRVRGAARSAAGAGYRSREMQRSGFRSRCCGGGGGAPITDIPGKQRIPDMRMDDIRETGPSWWPWVAHSARRCSKAWSNRAHRSRTSPSWWPMCCSKTKPRPSPSQPNVNLRRCTDERHYPPRPTRRMDRP
jgi:hypothetical protein